MNIPRRGVLAALAAAASLGSLLAVAGPATASDDPPQCWNAAVWARPELARTFELYCPRAERIELVTEPTASRFEGLVRGEWFKFRLTPEADAPEHDVFTVRLTGLGGSREQEIAITNVPPDRNTAPFCEPVSVAQRTPGTAPVSLFFFVWCDDAEHDGFEIRGGAPGAHSAPVSEEGGEAGSGNTGWNYLPTIASGEEQTTYHAVDSLGARSADAPISVKVGPAVDRLPLCRPNGSSSGFGFMPVLTRPGATRRFTVICSDEDGDPFRSRLQTPPSRGDLTLAGPGGSLLSGYGHEQWVDATYVPHTAYEGEDRFTMVADSARGEGPAVEMGMVARRLPSNGGAGCGWSGGQTQPGIPVTLEIRCSDSDGDPIEAEITAQPEHGTAGVPRIGAGSRAEELVQIDYRPQAGFEGIDSVTVAIREAGGTAMPIVVGIVVRDAQSPASPFYAIGKPYDWPELRPQGATWQPSVGQTPPVSPLNQARRALGTRSVRLVARIGDARVYAARSTLAAAPRRRALAVTCPVRCTVTSASTVVGGSAGKAKLRVKPGKAAPLVLALSRAQRARVKAAGRSRASFRLTVARPGRAARRATVRLALRG